MKLYSLILILCLTGSCNCLASTFAGQLDTLSFIYEKETTVPVVPNKEILSKFGNDPAYNYYEYQVKDVTTLQELIKNAIRKIFDRFWNTELSPFQADMAFWIIIIVVIVGIILLFVFIKPTWFFIDKKGKTTYRIAEESIDGIDFERMIREALAVGNYTDAVRWRYLQTLKKLQDKDLIVWSPNKTVNEYVATFNHPDLKSVFTRLSRLFLYFRYGNFEAEQSQYEEVDHLAGEIIQRL